jgi:membrane-associated phospholipid phosphatase
MYLLFIVPPFFLRPDQLRRLGRELVTSTIIAGLVFLAFPAHLGFPRALPEDEFYAQLFRGLFSVDQPFNLVPSLHVVFSTAICLALLESAKRMLRAGLLIWLALLMASTILVHQHHLVDVATGFLLALLVRYGWERKNA